LAICTKAPPASIGSAFESDLGMSALNGVGLQEHSRPYLEELCQRTGFTVSLAVLDGEDILYVGRARSPRRGQSKIDFGLAPGSRLPIYCTAMGKLLLAHLPAPEQRRVISEISLTKRAPNTITSKRALREDLERVREEGLAVNDQSWPRACIPSRCPSARPPARS
jgi:IclR family transcriptional regulator, pca regulon regulatory protein